MMKRNLYPSLCGLLFLLCACDTNIFSGVESYDPAERAAALLDQKKADQAIEVLSDALEENPEDWTLVSLMASAKAQKAGVDTTEVALKMATKDDKKETGTSSNPLTSLFTVLPTATQENLDLMHEAVDYINSIPDEERISADTFKLSMFNTSYTALQTKFFDNDGNGKFTIEELATLDEATAITILESLINVQAAAANYSAGDNTGKAASKVGEIASKISSQEGATTTEKLKNYLGAGATPTVPTP